MERHGRGIVLPLNFDRLPVEMRRFLIHDNSKLAWAALRYLDVLVGEDEQFFVEGV